MGPCLFRLFLRFDFIEHHCTVLGVFGGYWAFSQCLRMKLFIYFLNRLKVS